MLLIRRLEGKKRPYRDFILYIEHLSQNEIVDILCLFNIKIIKIRFRARFYCGLMTFSYK